MRNGVIGTRTIMTATSGLDRPHSGSVEGQLRVLFRNHEAAKEPESRIAKRAHAIAVSLTAT